MFNVTKHLSIRSDVIYSDYKQFSKIAYYCLFMYNCFFIESKVLYKYILCLTMRCSIMAKDTKVIANLDTAHSFFTSLTHLFEPDHLPIVSLEEQPPNVAVPSSSIDIAHSSLATGGGTTLWVLGVLTMMDSPHVAFLVALQLHPVALSISIAAGALLMGYGLYLGLRLLYPPMPLLERPTSVDNPSELEQEFEYLMSMF